MHIWQVKSIIARSLQAFDQETIEELRNEDYSKDHISELTSKAELQKNQKFKELTSDIEVKMTENIRNELQSQMMLFKLYESYSNDAQGKADELIKAIEQLQRLLGDASARYLNRMQFGAFRKVTDKLDAGEKNAIEAQTTKMQQALENALMEVDHHLRDTRRRHEEMMESVIVQRNKYCHLIQGILPNVSRSMTRSRQVVNSQLAQQVMHQNHARSSPELQKLKNSFRAHCFELVISRSAQVLAQASLHNERDQSAISVLTSNKPAEMMYRFETLNTLIDIEKRSSLTVIFWPEDITAWSASSNLMPSAQRVSSSCLKENSTFCTQVNGLQYQAIRAAADDVKFLQQEKEQLGRQLDTGKEVHSKISMMLIETQKTQHMICQQRFQKEICKARNGVKRVQAKVTAAEARRVDEAPKSSEHFNYFRRIALKFRMQYKKFKTVYDECLQKNPIEEKSRKASYAAIAAEAEAAASSGIQFVIQRQLELLSQQQLHIQQTAQSSGSACGTSNTDKLSTEDQLPQQPVPIAKIKTLASAAAVSAQLRVHPPESSYSSPVASQKTPTASIRTMAMTSRTVTVQPTSVAFSPLVPPPLVAITASNLVTASPIRQDKMPSASYSADDAVAGSGEQLRTQNRSRKTDDSPSADKRTRLKLAEDEEEDQKQALMTDISYYTHPRSTEEDGESMRPVPERQDLLASFGRRMIPLEDVGGFDDGIVPRNPVLLWLPNIDVEFDKSVSSPQLNTTSELTSRQKVEEPASSAARTPTGLKSVDLIGKSILQLMNLSVNHFPLSFRPLEQQQYKSLEWNHPVTQQQHSRNLDVSISLNVKIEGSNNPEERHQQQQQQQHHHPQKASPSSGHHHSSSHPQQRRHSVSVLPVTKDELRHHRREKNIPRPSSIPSTAIPAPQILNPAIQSYPRMVDRLAMSKAASSGSAPPSMSYNYATATSGSSSKPTPPTSKYPGLMEQALASYHSSIYSPHMYGLPPPGAFAHYPYHPAASGSHPKMFHHPHPLSAAAEVTTKIYKDFVQRGYPPALAPELPPELAGIPGLSSCVSISGGPGGGNGKDLNLKSFVYGAVLSVPEAGSGGVGQLESHGEMKETQMDLSHLEVGSGRSMPSTIHTHQVSTLEELPISAASEESFGAAHQSITTEKQADFEGGPDLEGDAANELNLLADGDHLSEVLSVTHPSVDQDRSMDTGCRNICPMMRRRGAVVLRGCLLSQSTAATPVPRNRPVFITWTRNSQGATGLHRPSNWIVAYRVRIKYAVKYPL